jgi:hypothetical protein
MDEIMQLMYGYEGMSGLIYIFVLFCFYGLLCLDGLFAIIGAETQIYWA